jgi:DNA uptake protein ComE-like DNA-binding protein
MTELQSFDVWAQDNYNPLRPDFLNPPQVEPTTGEGESTQEPSLDFNTWTVDEWVKVPGVGEKLAQRIIEGGPFNSVGDIGNVKGISERVLDGVRSLIS